MSAYPGIIIHDFFFQFQFMFVSVCRPVGGRDVVNGVRFSFSLKFNENCVRYLASSMPPGNPM